MSDNSQFDSSRTAWISRGFEQLVEDAANSTPSYDVLVIGSGYGGAIAAATLAGRVHDDGNTPVSVCVLERGREYLPGAFPKGFTEIPAHVRLDSRKSGLFDIRPGPEVCTVAANGIGGGSLINAGVMEIPREKVFEKHWPAELSDRSALDPFYERAKRMLGAKRNGQDNTIEDHPDGVPRKFEAIRDLAAGERFDAAAITVAMDDSASSGNVRLNKCLRCGDCATGCNHGAKDSLDVNLLVKAHLAGAGIYSGATVLSIERHAQEPVWIVSAVYTDAKLRARHGSPVRIHASNVILAAGTLGSTEILERSRSSALRFSHQLGRRCSTNGDMLITDYDTSGDVHAVADEAVQPSQRAVGPTITGVMKTRENGDDLVIEEMAVPAGLRRAFAEIFSTTNALHSLYERDCSTHVEGIPDDDIYMVGRERIERSALYAVMGDDGADGRIELQGDLGTDRDGVARMRWEGLQSRPVFGHQVNALSRLTRGTNGRLLPNPVWKLLPDDMSFLVNDRQGPLLTVHPLGGCAMADSAEHGVVNHRGEVFNPVASVTDVHDGLVVLDGAVIPTALATNPALTIAAVSLRAAESLAVKWGYAEPGNGGAQPEPAPLERPVFRESDQAFDPAPTRVELNERMSGAVSFTDAAGAARDCVVELTLRSEDKTVAELTTPPGQGGNPELRVDTTRRDAVTDSRIRVYDAQDWTRINLERVSARTMERQLEAACLFEAPVSGTLRVLERQRSSAWGRLLRAGWAWIWNRGLRDTWQAVFNGGDGGPGFMARVKGGIALATRAGEVRLIKYDLRIGNPVRSNGLQLNGDRVTGAKRFTYGRRANPWRQLMRMSLEEFPGLGNKESRRVLELDLAYLARIGVPLFRITNQADGATALAEVASFFGYFLRLLVGIHIWSFRSPDEDKDVREPVRLPGKLPGIPAPEIHTLHLGDEKPDGAIDGAPVPVNIRLTRYAVPSSAHPPILMIHGYSASGTTFAHPSVDPNFASYFHELGFDVWILDMRTSSGLDTATQPWSFEQAAYRDVPVAVDHIFRETGSKVRVIAHCMGAVVFSMAVLHSGEPNLPGESLLYQRARRSLKDRIERVAFTQVGPLVVFSPANVFRGYASRFLIEFLPDHYTFNPGPDASLADDLLDRVLSTLPYPEDEFDIENPPWPPWRRTPWVRTRHRMDALYGRDFNVVNMGQEVLDRIDDHFGPLSIKTVAQTIHFARYSIITNKNGRNTFVSRKLFERNWDFPVHSVHARWNGLSDVATVFRMEEILRDAGRAYTHDVIGRAEQAGHQDALVGRPRMQTFECVKRFFEAPPGSPRPANTNLNAYPPWIGPVVTVEEQPTFPQPTRARSIRLGTRPTHRAAVGVIMLRASYDGDRVTRPDGQAWDQQYIRENMLMFSSPELRDGWGKFWEPDENVMPRVGDGLLVLVVYDEADELGESGAAYLRTSVEHNMRVLERLWPIGWRRIGLDPGSPQPKDDKIPDEKWEPIDFPRVYLPEDRILYLLEEMTSVVLQALIEQNAELVLLRDEEKVEEPPEVIDVPIAFHQRDALGNTTEIRIREREDLVHGFIPDEQPDDAGFALVSCQYPAGFLDDPTADKAYGQVVRRIDEGGGIKPRFTVLTGDQVYVDATAGLYDPTQGDDRFENPYLVWLRDESVRGVLRRVPSFMMLDDHEIDDNWEPLSWNDPDNRALMENGRASYIKYQRGLTHDREDPELSFSFSYAGVEFYMLNTRTAREPRTATNVASQSLISDTDLADLEAWLQQGNAPKFIVTPSMLLPRHRRAVQWTKEESAVSSDGWDGYPATLFKVLELIAANSVQHVVFLSGDEHRGSVVTIDITDTATGNVTRTHSIHTQGAYTPFPFANSLEEDFIASELFTFQTEAGAPTYTCNVDTAFQSPRNGVTYLKPRLENGTWQLDYQFADDAVQTIDI